MSIDRWLVDASASSEDISCMVILVNWPLCLLLTNVVITYCQSRRNESIQDHAWRSTKVHELIKKAISSFCNFMSLFDSHKKKLWYEIHYNARCRGFYLFIGFFLMFSFVLFVSRPWNPNLRTQVSFSSMGKLWISRVVANS